MLLVQRGLYQLTNLSQLVDGGGRIKLVGVVLLYNLSFNVDLMYVMYLLGSVLNLQVDFSQKICPHAILLGYTLM